MWDIWFLGGLLEFSWIVSYYANLFPWETPAGIYLFVKEGEMTNTCTTVMDFSGSGRIGATWRIIRFSKCLMTMVIVFVP